ncbi:MAG: DUF302 domain-containing protein [Gammaproteobacteria bacterium]|nr:DUF302 domain-containing protein [Gammaproteobacteria bacterium]
MIKKLLLSLVLLAFAVSVQAAEGPKAGVGLHMTPEMMRGMVHQSMQIYPLADGVTMDDAIESMKLRANNLNFKLVAELPLSKQVEAMGKKARRMDILAFCDALIAKEMVEFDPIFAGFLPCRIALIEGADGNGMIVTMNMDMMLNAVDLPDSLIPLAETVRDSIYSIVDAGVNGDL